MRSFGVKHEHMSIVPRKILQVLLVWARIFPVVLFAITCARADDITLDVDVVAAENVVTVTVRNRGTEAVPLIGLEVSLGGHSFPRYPSLRLLEPQQAWTDSQVVQFPERPGSYPLITSVFYENDGARMSVLNVGLFNYKGQFPLDVDCPALDIALRDSRVVTIEPPKGSRLRLVLPHEIEMTQDANRFYLRNTRPFFNNNSAIYGTLEDPNGEVHRSKICPARLITKKIAASISLFSSKLLLLFGALAFATTGIFLWALLDKNSVLLIAAARWSFSISLLSSLLFLFRNLSFIPDYFLEPTRFDSLSTSTSFGARVVQTFLSWFYFEGGDYDYFAQYVQDPLYIYMLGPNLLVLYFLIRPKPATDKYWQVMLSIYRWLPIIGNRLRTNAEGTIGEFAPRLAKIGYLTIAVKAFYVPLLTSWTINNILHQANITRAFTWSIPEVTAYVIATCILIDVVIFAAGYLTELPQLKNQIRSVEPTLLGWLVCLMCYPPFNQFSFMLFDVPLDENWRPSGEVSAELVNGVIALLWIIYAWATVALGFKSSNLTNRGIVSRGPYRYMRHPAYVSKVLLWIISSVFLGEKNFFLIVSLVIVYALRAWTEERHLSLDPEYLEYKKLVRWKLFPGVW